MRKSPLLVLTAAVLLALACSTHFVNDGGVPPLPDRTVGSDTMSRSIGLTLVQSPSISDPRVILRSAMDIGYVDQVEHAAAYVRMPSPALDAAVVGSCVLSLALAVYLGTHGYADAGSIGGTALTVAGVYVVAAHLWPQERHIAFRREPVSMESSEPLDVDIQLNGSGWHKRLKTGSDCLAELDLAAILDVLPARKSIAFQAQVVGMPEHACSVSVERSVVDALVEIQAREERERREAEQQRLRAADAQRRAELEAASRVWQSLTPALQGILDMSFSYATADFQLAIIQTTELKTYGAFLALRPEGRIRVLRRIGRSVGTPTWSILLQQTLRIPAYLAEAILATYSGD